MNIRSRMMADIARLNPDVVSNMRQGDAEQFVIDAIRHNSVPIDRLTTSILESRHVVVLLRVAAECLRDFPDRLNALATTLYKADDEIWEAFSRSDLRYVAELFDKADLFRLLAERNAEILTDRSHPLFSLLSSDSYWQSLVESHLSHGDFRQAWSDARRALRGFLPANSRPPNIDEFTDFPSESHCTHQISSSSFEVLVKLIFNYMSEKGLIEAEITEEECKNITPKMRTIRYSKMRKNGTKVPKPAIVMVDRAGDKYAKRFATLVSGGYRQRYLYSPTSIMIFRIAGYEPARKQEASRRAWLGLCEEYGVDPTKLEPVL